MYAVQRRWYTLMLLLATLASLAQAQICTVAGDCNSRASTVTFTGGQCVCGPCRNQWSGSQCQLCPVAFNQADDCGSCNTAEMYGGTYPNCVSVRCTQDDCNNRAVSVTGNRTAGCVCYCQNQWQGNTCQTCPAGLDSTSNCGACLSGYTGYPACSLACTNAANCSSHADAVYGTTATNCTCLCLNLWSGSTCSSCPQYVSTTTTAQCGDCITGYEGYPTCVLKCTTAANCSGHASTVSGNSNTGCNCTCQNQWKGNNCSTCAYGFEQTNCGACITGYSGYPNCAQTCTAATDCNNKGVASGTYATGCTCKCQNFWTAASNCSVCPLGYDASQSCSVCASGYSGLPNCTRSCDVTTDCSNHAYSVSGSTYAGCVCNCKYGWSGNNCSVCPANSGGTDCDTCASGYTGTPPSCVKQCTLAADCGTGASQVSGTSTGCKCTCRNAWSGTKCDTCPPAYLADSTHDCDTCNTNSGYPSYEVINSTCLIAPPACPCVLSCSNTYNCSGRALSVTGNSASTCTCSCRNQFTGPTCSTCPDKYGGTLCNTCGTGYGGSPAYPNCTKLCTLTDCSGRATSVSGVVGSCVCVCANQWTGANCSTCPSRFSSTSSFCASCATGYDTYPSCYKSCTVANCSNHALTVVGNNNTGCNCTCRNSWYGLNCSLCPALVNASQDCGICIDGYGDYPNCKQFCNNSADCNNHAAVVLGFKGSCTCNCRNQWNDTTCSSCPWLYNATQDCGVCIAGYDTYPGCYLTCTVASNCSSHATNVTGNTFKGCNCSCLPQWSGSAACNVCANNWTGSNCDQCPDHYNASKNCGACDSGYTGYPNCVRSCTSEIDCNDHAASVSGTIGNCTCKCRNQWSGANCSTCPALYNASSDCGICITGYDTYPSCYLTCTVASNCSSHATNVTGNTFKGCNCSCLPQWSGSGACNVCANNWTGSNCDQCPDHYNASKNCGACDSGYTGYPNCVRSCTSEIDCNDHAASVSGTIGNCTCKCRSQWSGANCSTCPALYNASSDCGACVAGRDTYPSCYLTCTVASNCSSHATNVTGNTFKGCNCSCLPQWSGSAACNVCANNWTGSNCDQCPDHYNASKNCGACDSGYTGYPNCVRSCTSEIDCNDHAASVSGTIGNCTCKCRSQWSGANCSTCPALYNASSDCGACVAGRDTYPSCYLTCTVASNCSSHATNVTGNTFKGCNCSCLPQWGGSAACNVCANNWTGSNCDQCPDHYNESKNCGACDSGYTGYPNCVRSCTSEIDCNDHAASVSGTIGNCTCKCRSQWSGVNCSTCPALYNASSDCGACVAGRDTYPSCYLTCTVANCSGHATNVTGNTFKGCNCSCTTSWNDLTCSSCPARYDPSANCATCNAGYSGSYPDCTRTCLESDCFNHSTSVSGRVPNCVCSCRNGWTALSLCATCPPQFNATDDCGSCNMTTHEGTFPNCYLKCTAVANCSNHSVAVTGNTNIGCSCSCRNNWTTGDCALCPAHVNASKDCGACDIGYEQYPFCLLTCTSVTDCSNHSAVVTGTSGNCTCSCRNQWSDATCSTCPALFNPSRDCGECVAGRDTYPNCYLTCTTSANCSGHATNVTGNNNTGCNCSCQNRWTGLSCEQCPDHYNASKNCGACDSGYTGYPNCVRSCTSEIDCNDHAASVSGTIGNCTCKCRSQWSGANCSTCPALYNASSDCGACVAGRDTYPSCYLTCTVASNCSSHATNVTGNTFVGCSCSCLPQWSGSAACNVCANNWTGSNCDQCPDHYNASKNCGACDSGYTGYPNCVRSCTSEIDCNDHAASVSGTIGNCTCKCRSQWSGANCSTCPALYNASSDCGACVAGRDTYPSCYLTCTVASNCSSHATNVTGNTFVGCNCSCTTSWSSGDCSYCPSPYDPASNCAACNPDGFGGDYPNCRRVCDAVLDCNSHALNASGVTPNCTCSCRNQWNGATCNNCPGAYNALNDCGSCATLYVGTYPQCYLGCNVVDNCNSHASSVTGNTFDGCNCSCRGQWNGSTCAVCPPLYNANQDCGVCISGYINYPKCDRVCTNNLDCNGHALSVSGIEGNCTCVCRNQWSGSSCNACPANFAVGNGTNATTCSTCAAGYDTYPSCYLTCTTMANCSAHATSVTGNTFTSCNCSCRNSWYGSTCSQCPSNVDTGSDCGACASAYDTYPQCYLTCTTAANCSGHADSVSGNTNTGCKCFCRASWSGDICDTCVAKYNTSVDCSRCANGYTNYPECPRICTNEADCGNHASAVSGLYPNCQCTCRNSWSVSSNCTNCPAQYDPDYDCYYCNVGYTGIYPTCNALCSIQAACNGNAKDVSGTTETGCNCTCQNQWITQANATANGNTTQCNYCPPNYDAAASCGACASTYVDYPICKQLCTPSADCNSHADTATGYRPNCTCSCRNQWHGNSCDTCAKNFSASNDCGTCTGGYEDYPYCYFACTTTANCSNHATDVVGNDAVGCLCDCRNAWSGLNCSVCPDHTDASNDCASCLTGFYGYPRCRRQCTNALDCNGRADGVSGLEGDCICTCRNAYDPLTNCSTCPTGFNASTDCASCSAGYEQYPHCYRVCTVEEDCAGHAESVTGNVNTTCQCRCSAQWYGSNCSQCDAKFDQATCSSCAVGYEDYPSCYLSCTIEADCNGRAASVTGNAFTGCVCRCLAQWSDGNCSSCPALYNASNGCGSCTAGFDSYPDCYQSCTLANCTSGSTLSVSGNSNTGCVCHCLNAYSDPTCSTCAANFTVGSSCGSCASGYEGYPYCYRTCTLDQDCDGNAVSVTGNDNTGCVCRCRNQWSGPHCATCTGNYEASNDCSSCTYGFESYPYCYQTCTTVNCSSQGAATGNSNTSCSCSCLGGWSGSTCSTCPSNFNVSLGCMACATGYQDYPQCYASCTSADCNNRGVASGNRVVGCSCSCRNAWYGRFCQYCPEQFDAESDCFACASGYYGTYPYCTNPSNSSGGNSTSGVVQGCGAYTEHVVGTWTPGSSVTAATTLKDAEVLFNEYLQQVGCGSSCSRGYLVSRIGGNSFKFDITVNSATADSALTIANCYNGVMNNGSYWPGSPPSSSQWPDDPDYYYGCQHGLFNWSYCASWCYYLYENGNYSCCTWWYNRCYHYNCNTSSVSCDVNFSGGGTGYNVTVNGTCEADPVCKKRSSKWIWGSGTPSPSLTATETVTLRTSFSHTIDPLSLNAPELTNGLLSGGALWGLIVGIVALVLLCLIILFFMWKKRRSERTDAGRGRRYTKTARTLEDLRGRADSKFVFDELLGDDELGRVAANIEGDDGTESSDELEEMPINASLIPPPQARPAGQSIVVRLPPPPPVKQQEVRFDDI